MIPKYVSQVYLYVLILNKSLTDLKPSLMYTYIMHSGDIMIISEGEIKLLLERRDGVYN